MQKLKESYERYKKTGKGSVKFSYPNGEPTIVPIIEIMKDSDNNFITSPVGGRRKHTSNKPSSPKHNISPRRSHTPNKHTSNFLRNTIDNIKISSMSPRSTMNNNAYVNLSEELKILTATNEKVSNLLTSESDNSKEHHTKLFGVLDKINDTTIDVNKNTVKDNEKIIGILEKIHDTLKSNRIYLEKIEEKMDRMHIKQTPEVLESIPSKNF